MGKRPAGRGVEHRIEIAAPVSAVWRVIADLDHWGAWNPLYIAAKGTPIVGEPFAMTIALEGMKPQKAQARIVSAEPEALLEYGITNLGGLVKAFRYIDLRALDSGRCEIANGEIMSGLVGNLLARVIGEKVRRGLQGMNEALKAKLEADPRPIPHARRDRPIESKAQDGDEAVGTV
ncbi:MAG: SRPBCC domain-containing protein [Novosphingobium sp.]|nr:SRPBCC domain-containing protein [Novosphingobium sp.]